MTSTHKHPHAGRSVNEKEEFSELMEKVVTSEKVLVGGDFNGHVGIYMDGLGEVHESFGIGKTNDGGTRLQYLDRVKLKQ